MLANNRIRVITAVLAAAVFCATPSRAHADEDSALAWGYLAGELSTAGIFYLNFGTKSWPNKGPALALNMSPILIGIGSAFAAHKAELDPTPAYAIHGATSLGFNMYMLGMLIDGRNERDGLKSGPLAWTLGGLGMAGGAWIGATQIDGDSAPAYFVAPTGGFLVGGFIGLVTGLFRRKDPFHNAVWGATIGLAAGIAGSVIYAATRDDDPSSQPRTLDGRRKPKPAVFSWSGVF